MPFASPPLPSRWPPSSPPSPPPPPRFQGLSLDETAKKEPQQRQPTSVPVEEVEVVGQANLLSQSPSPSPPPHSLRLDEEFRLFLAKKYKSTLKGAVPRSNPAGSGLTI